jgi:protein-tyrosine phosphatase
MGRTAIVIASYLVYAGIATTGEEAIQKVRA